LEDPQAATGTDAVCVALALRQPITRLYMSFIATTRVLTVLKSWMQDHHMLDAEPEAVARFHEFLTYIKTPEKHKQIAKSMLSLMEKELVRLPNNIPLKASIFD
jgi:hypothetical protein